MVKKNKMKKIIIYMMLLITTFADETSFVTAFNTMWQTHNASNILIFVEQNVTTNSSPETLFARGIVAGTLQGWGQGQTNYWEQAMQMLADKEDKSDLWKTNAVNQIQWIQILMSTKGVDDNPPSWNTNAHSIIFSILGDEPPFYDTLKNITDIEK